MRRAAIAGTALGLFLAILIGCHGTTDIDPGSGSFTWQGLTVHYDAPEAMTNAPVLIVLHGQSRTAQSYRDTWRTHTRARGAQLIVPEFTEADYPGEDYTLGPEVRAAIETLFDHVVHDTGSSRTTYLLYGFSAGGQVAHRFLQLNAPNRASRMVVGAPGWYTTPETNVAWPYGLGGMNVSTAERKRALGETVFVMVGSEDDDPNDPDVRHTPEADAQGPHRRARAAHFYLKGAEAAENLGTPFAWTHSVVAGCGHSNSCVAPAAAAELFG